MGAQTSKVGKAYKRFFRRKKLRNKKNNDEGTKLLSLQSYGDTLSYNCITKQMTVICCENIDELEKMNGFLETVSKQLKENIDTLVDNYKRTLTESKKDISTYLEDIENHNMSISKSTKKCNSLPEEFKDLQIAVENGRLLYNILLEKMENCDEYLGTFKEFIETTFHKSISLKKISIRQNLTNRLKKGIKEGNIVDCIDIICQILVATNCSVSENEMSLIMDTYSKKIDQMFEFYSKLVKGIEFYGNKHFLKSFESQQFFNSILEDARCECSELFDILIKIKDSTDEFHDESNVIVYTCKYFLAVSVTGFWLEITPREHDDFDEVNGFFYDSLTQYFYALKAYNGIINKRIFMPETFEDTLKELCQQYPNIIKNTGLKKFLKNQLKISFEF
uniref:Translin-associated protein X n=1 Tax=Strongyloides stercoralis TaxID=6248 RepID=A0A0K0DW88_STRER